MRDKRIKGEVPNGTGAPELLEGGVVLCMCGG